MAGRVLGTQWRAGCSSYTLLIFTYISLLPALATATAICFFRDGSVATYYRNSYESNPEGWVQCPGQSFCCPEAQYCENNGLCRDKGNYANGSLLTFSGPDGPESVNYTGLYQTSACANFGWTGCFSECVTASTFSGSVNVWACTDDLDSYCCHLDNAKLDFRKGCCNQTARFYLPRPVALLASPSRSAVTSAGVTNTSEPGDQAFAGSVDATSTPPGSLVGKDGRRGAVGLTRGAKIGIGVGVPLFLVLVAAAGVLICRARRLSKGPTAHRGDSEPQDAVVAEDGRGGLEPEVKDPQAAVPSELDAHRVPQEVEVVNSQESKKEESVPLSPVEVL